MERWKKVSQVAVTVSISGGLWTLKGYPQGLPNITMTIDASMPSVQMTPYLNPTNTGHFEADRVWITDSAGNILDDRTSPRAAFANHVRETPWDDLHQLYFAGAGFWNYFTTPFLLTRPEVETSEIEPIVENGERLRRLKVKFSPAIPTHSEEQTFHFSEDGILRRLDYVTVEKGVASHYCFDHKSFDGLLFPTLRRVVQRNADGPRVFGPTSVLVRVHDVLIS
jgi:hypothetical protein